MLPNQRHLFTLPDDVTYLNCAYTAPLLKSAAAAGERALRQKANPWELTAAHFFQTLAANRRLFGRLVQAPPEQVALIPAVSYGVALAARNLPVAAGQTIVMLAEQFPSHVYAWQRLARTRQAAVVTVDRPVDGDWTPAVLAAIDAHTAIAALPHCHWTDGTVLDLAAIGARCREVGAALVVDGTQSLGAMPFAVPEVQPDFLIATSHKWLLGPYSYGFCYVAPRWSQGAPLEENWLNREGSEDFARLVDYRDGYQPGAARFDVGEASNFILAPVAEAALTQILEWGVAEIAASLRTRTDQIAARARAVGFATAAARNRAPHLLGLQVPGDLPRDLPARLAAERVFVSVRGRAIRVAPHLYNTEEDVARLFAALAKHLDGFA
jgi:selenocysteine lyase/cysteine desulfurase